MENLSEFAIKSIAVPQHDYWTKKHVSAIVADEINNHHMSHSCIITGKKTTTGFNVSHSNQKTKRKLYPNLQKKRLKNPATGRTITVIISTRGLKTLRKWDREGKAYDLAALKKEAELVRSW